MAKVMNNRLNIIYKLNRSHKGASSPFHNLVKIMKQ